MEPSPRSAPKQDLPFLSEARKQPFIDQEQELNPLFSLFQRLYMELYAIKCIYCTSGPRNHEKQQVFTYKTITHYMCSCYRWKNKKQTKTHRSVVGPLDIFSIVLHQWHDIQASECTGEQSSEPKKRGYRMGWRGAVPLEKEQLAMLVLYKKLLLWQLSVLVFKTNQIHLLHWSIVYAQSCCSDLFYTASSGQA